MLVVAACTMHAARASATPAADAEAEALITRGITLREQGKDDEALGLFRSAYTKSPSPRAGAQVALAEQALGLWVAAEADLMRALAVESDPWILKNRAALEGALAVIRRRLGSLEIRGNDGADVVLDGVRLGALPATAPFRVEAGKRNLELRAKGFHPTTRAIEIPAGGVARETVTLVALSADPAASPAGAPAHDDDGRSDPGRTQRLLGWTFTGIGGALLVTGGVGFVVRKGHVDDYNSSSCPGLGAAQPAECDDKIESARTWLTVSIVSLIAGGVFAIGGITLVATAPRRDRSAAAAPRSPKPSGVRASCAPTALGGAGASLACVGTF